jgi:hypothetical protein
VYIKMMHYGWQLYDERRLAMDTAPLTPSSSAPADCTDESLISADFSRRDVLIGTVRSQTQLDYSLASLSYYAPVRTIAPADLPIARVALYEEGLAGPAVIAYHGRVTDIRVVRRTDIPVSQNRPNGDEAYYLFSVDAWESLPCPIVIEGTSRGRPAFTTEFLLMNARRSYQLVCIRSAAEYRLTAALCHLLDEAAEKTAPVFRRIGESHVLGAAEGILSLLHARGEVLFRCPLQAMHTQPAEVVHRLATLLGLR